MYDIEFFQKTDELKSRIMNGELTAKDVNIIESELDHFRSKQPHLFNVETSNFCNMTCIMCPRTTLMTRENQWIDDEAFEEVLDQIKPHGSEDVDQFWNFIESQYGVSPKNPSEDAFYFYTVSKCLILHGFGEPLVDKNIVRRVSACSDRGIPTYFSCVPANISVSRSEKVMEAGLNVLKFSIDSLTDDGAKKIRGKLADFESSYRTILEILELKERKGYKTTIVPCMINLAGSDENQEMQREFLDLWKGLDVFAYVKSQDNRWYFEEDEKVENRSHYFGQYCEAPWLSLTVMADGSVVPCTQDYDCELAMGNARTSSLKDIWNGDEYKKLRHFHVTGKFPAGHKCVERCDLPKLFQRMKKN